MRTPHKTLLVSALLAAYAAGLSCSSEDPVSASDDFIEIRSGNIVLAATLDLPPGDGPHPVIVWGHGSGEITRAAYAGVASRIASQLGIASLRFDKRGVGQSTGTYRDVNAGNSAEVFEVLADDLVAAVEYLKGHPSINANQIGLYGASQAGWIMPLAASRSEDVAFMVSISGAASSVGVSDYYDGIAELGLTDEQIADSLENFDGTHGFDPVPYLEALDIPALWVYGGQDKSNPTANDIAILEGIVAQKGKDYTIHVFPNADHGLNDVGTGQPVRASQECVDPWLLAHVDVTR